MGVRGLQTYLEKCSRKACYEINILELAKKYNDNDRPILLKSRMSSLIPTLIRMKSAETGKDAVIVIDAQSCYHLWSGGLIGYEISLYINRLRTFVESFKKAGIRLVFFFGGLNPEKKRKTWLERRRRNIREIHGDIDALMIPGRVPSNFRPILPNPGVTTSYILKYVLDCEVYMAVKECDEEIIDYVKKHKCFAIFGQNSDFVISQVDAVVLSSNKFKIKQMTTLLYDRRELAQVLGLQVDELPLFALLAGNDLVHPNIQGFHRKIVDDSEKRRGVLQYQKLMPAIGRYIRGMRNKSLGEKLRRMAKDLFNDLSREQLLRLSYNSYIVEETTVDVPLKDSWSQILHAALSHYRNARMPSLLYSVLTEQIFEGGTSYEDLRIHNDKMAFVRDQCSSSVLRPLRSRLYGILLFEKEDGSNTVQEWTNDNISSYLRPYIVQSDKPEVHHPGLMVLWSDIKNDCINDMRWKLFLTSIHPTINTAKWQSFNKELLFTTLSVYFLFKREYLNESEMDAVLLTIATCPLYNQEKLSSLSCNKLDFRVSDISITLNRTYGLVLTLLAACGYPVPLSSKNAYLQFEVKLFQKKFTDVMKKEDSHEALCENDANSLKVFHQMRNIILEEDNDEELDENIIDMMSKMQVQQSDEK